MKKLINAPQTAVERVARGIWLPMRKSGPCTPTRHSSRATTRSGGQGRPRQRRRERPEPLHGGFVGSGMLDGAVPGRRLHVSDPRPDRGRRRGRRRGAGVLHIVKNYTGDVLNFETAAELAAAEGITVRTVLVDDDVAVEDSLYTAGRRGWPARCWSRRSPAPRPSAATTSTPSPRWHGSPRVRSMGVALTACTVPHAGEPSFALADEIEIGIGIHGEPGRRRITLEPADAIVDDCSDPCSRTSPFASGEKVLLFVNGMGGTPPPSSTSSIGGPRGPGGAGSHVAIAGRQLHHLARDAGLLDHGAASTTS